MRTKALYAALLLPACAGALGAYFNGGLASFGDLETRVRYGPFTFQESEPLGVSYWVGGGLAVPLWRGAGPVSPGLELATDVGYGSKTKEVENSYLAGYEISWGLVAVRESVLFGVAAGPAKPFVGFGGGVAVVPWAFDHIATGIEVDSQTEVKAAFGIPFGLEFNLTPTFALGFRGEYLIITGDITPKVELEGAHTEVPNALLACGTAGLNL
jgi:opacity protein-like surface antigen